MNMDHGIWYLVWVFEMSSRRIWGRWGFGWGWRFIARVAEVNIVRMSAIMDDASNRKQGGRTYRPAVQNS